MVVYFLSLCWSIVFCISSAGEKSYSYDLLNPSDKMKLESDLVELSGLSYAKGRLYAIQDEKGKIFILNPSSGLIIEDHKFWGKGDYEGIEVVGERIYVMSSKGKLYVSPLETIDEELTTKVDLGFDSNWNFEALGYDPATMKLFMGAKRSTKASEKEVFAISPEDPQALGQPIRVLQESEFSKALQKTRKNWTERLVDDISSLSYSFNPSAMAVHPGNGEIYVLSSPVPQLAIFNPDWKLRKVFSLDSKIYRQPESICFDDQMNMYIGNEGQSGKANILKFVPL